LPTVGSITLSGTKLRSRLFTDGKRWAEVEMGNRDVVTIGASAGGVEALVFLAGKLPPELEASILVTIHLASEYRSWLDVVLTRSGPLAASFATDGEVMQKSRIYIAPPARHLLIEGNRLTLGIGPRENHARPAIDPMMRSAAACCGSRSIGVVLTGASGDGASGLSALKRCGGIAVVQDPEDARFSQMPETALRRSNVDRVASLAEMPALLERLVQEPAGAAAPVPAHIKDKVEIAKSGYSSTSLAVQQEA
jgi:two-component system chemotaxis response regulator CheB